MHRYARIQEVTYHLIDDDIVELAFREHRFSYRLRVWRSRLGPAIVLASQVPGGVPPCWQRSKLANLAHRAYLCFPQAGMLYFEAGFCPTAYIVEVEFRTCGLGQRRLLVEPTERGWLFRDFRKLVGADVRQ